jgi:hypothetical protein
MVLSVEQEAACIAFRRHTLLPLDGCLCALQPSIPVLTRSSLHRLFLRHGINRSEEVRDKPSHSTFKAYAIGSAGCSDRWRSQPRRPYRPKEWLWAEVRTEEGKLQLFVGIDRTSKLVFARLETKATRMIA